MSLLTLGIKDINHLGPDGLLGIIDLAQIKNRTLNPAVMRANLLGKKDALPGWHRGMKVSGFTFLRRIEKGGIFYSFSLSTGDAP